MAHYAFLDENNIVVEVITGIDESDTSTLPSEFSSWEEFYADFRGLTCKRTSYNTKSNVHEDGGTAFRGNFAGKGYTYDATNDIFLPPKNYDSWVLDTANANWKAPVDEPSDTNYDADTSLPIKNYEWNEETEAWDLVSTYTYDADAEEWDTGE
jgi:hypothetical protein